MAEPTLDLILGLERRVWDALVDGDASADAALLADDFLGVYATGYGDKSEHVTQLASGPTVSVYSLQDARLLALSADMALLVYRGVYRRAGGRLHGALEEMFVSSLWRREPHGWRNLFSQDTARSDMRPV